MVGLKLNVVPVGTPVADRLIELLKPPLTAVVIVDVPRLPCMTMSEAGEAEMVKLGTAVTVSVTVVLCWVPPPLPVTVMGYVPTAVLAPTVMVMVELPAPGAGIVCGLKLTVVPVGTPVADRLIELLKPPLTTVVIVDVPRLPCMTMSEAGEAEMVKLGTAVTVSVTVVLCWVPPPLPVTVMGYVPTSVLAPTVMVMVELPAPGAGIVCGLKLTVVPVGTPVADRLIELLKPPLTTVVIVDVPRLPCMTVSEAGEAEMLKLGTAVTVSVTVVPCWIPPPLPVTVMGYVPTSVLAPTVMVMVELPAPGAGIVCGLKLTVVPVGTPVADRLIELLKPPLTTVVIVDVPRLPCMTVSEAGEAEMLKLGTAVTVRVTVVPCWIPPPFPVTVMGYVPTGVLAPTVMVIVELPAPGAGIVLGLKLTVVPVGTPVADRLIELLKPPLTTVVIVDVPRLPCMTMSEAGEAEMVKLGTAVTVRVTVVLCWVPPPLPVTVMGYVPTSVLAPTVMVMVELPAPGAGIVCGLKLTVVPVGTPVADRLIELLKPPLTTVVIVDVPRLPCMTVSEAGEAEMLKLGTAVTVSVTVVPCWIPPPFPVTVMGYVPTSVLAPTVMVIVELPAPGAGIVCGLKLTVVPVGTPVADRLIELLKPPLTTVVIVDVPRLPCMTVSEAGEAEMLKLGTAVTVSVTVVPCWIPPPFPVTVMGYVPTSVLAPTVMVIVELPAPGAGIVCGLKLTVVPVGTPVADRLIELLKPPLTAVVIVDVP